MMVSMFQHLQQIIEQGQGRLEDNLKRLEQVKNTQELQKFFIDVSHAHKRIDTHVEKCKNKFQINSKNINQVEHKGGFSEG